MPFEERGEREAIKLEKKMLIKDVTNGLSSQFWGKNIESPISVDCVAALSPAEAAPGSLCEPTGISRSQFKIATQAMNIIALPSYVQTQGGLVLDRVMGYASGDNWWSTAALRIKLQQLMTSSYRGSPGLLEPQNYSFCANTKFSLGSESSVKLRAEIDPAGIAPSIGLEPLAALAAEEGSFRMRDLVNFNTMSLAATLKSNLEGCALSMNAAINQRMLGGAGELDRYYLVPLSSSVDLNSESGSHNGFVYKAGLFHVTAPCRGAELGSEGKPERNMLRTAVYAQAAGGLRGGMMLWQGKKHHHSHKAEPEARPSPVQLLGRLTRIFRRVEREEERSIREGRGPLNMEETAEALGGLGGKLRHFGDNMGDWASWVAQGGLHESLRMEERLEKKEERKHMSNFLPSPHVAVGGMVGYLARATPISHVHHPRGHSHQQRRLAYILGEGLQESIEDEVEEAVEWGLMASKVVRRAAKKGLRNLRETMQFRPFATGVASLQLGANQRPLLSFTRLTARADVGLTLPEVMRNGVLSHPAFSLDSRAAGAALTLSGCQQVYGPVRILADARLAVGSMSPCPPLRDVFSSLFGITPGASSDDRGDEYVTPLGGLGQHIMGMRGQLLEVVTGLELVVPGSKGAARLVATYAPAKKEAMLRVQLL